MNFLLLRQIAECASGMRERDHTYVVTGDTFQIDPPTIPPGALVIPVKATVDPASRVVRAQISDQPTGDLLDLMDVPVAAQGPYPGNANFPENRKADAVFWTVSAVEKFLIPYYASVYGDQAPEIVRDVLEILRPTSIQPVPPPYAIAHLPSSEYVEMPNADSITTPGVKRDYFDDMFVLRAGHAEPLTRTWRQDALAASQGGGAQSEPAAAPAPGAAPPATAAAA